MKDKENIIGLIAGGTRLPFIVADGAKRAGMKVVCVSLGGSADASLGEHVDVFSKVPLARIGVWIRKLKKHGVRRAIMVGKVPKDKLYARWRILRNLPDWRVLRIYYWRLRKDDKRDDKLLGALADELASGGIILEDSTMYCKEHLASKGVMTKVLPGVGVKEDIEFGWQIVKKLGELDIGQAVSIKEKAIMAVEAIEGTASMIERTGKYCKKGGWTLLKAEKLKQDSRFDVPCVGSDTIRSLAKNGGKCLVVEAEKTLIVDKPETIELANKLGIAIVGY